MLIGLPGQLRFEVLRVKKGSIVPQRGATALLRKAPTNRRSLVHGSSVGIARPDKACSTHTELLCYLVYMVI